MNIFNNVSTPSLNVNTNELRQAKLSTSPHQNSYKEAFKLDINPRYITQDIERIAIADEEALFYTSQLDIVKKS